MKKTYKIDVDCANCANKMEEAAKNTAGVKDATVNFMTLKMNVEFEEGKDPKEVMQDVLYKVLSCQTYNKSILKDIPNNEEFFNTHIFKYVIGDIVLCQEYSKEFSTKEKPWMTRRTTALLPIKFEVIENADWTHVLSKNLEVDYGRNKQLRRKNGRIRNRI